MKKITAIVLAVILSVVMLITLSVSGCKTTGTAETTAAETTAAGATTAETTAAEATTAETGKKINLIVYEQESEENDKYFEPFIEEFEKQNPNIEVTMAHYETEDARTNFQAAVIAGENVQMLMGPHDWAGLFGVANIVKSLDDLVDMSIYSEAIRNAGVYKGVTYGVPLYSESAMRLFYNKTLIPEPPKNTDELLTLAQAATKGDVQGFAYWVKAAYFFIPWLSAYGSWPLDENAQPVFDNEATIKAFKLLHSWVADGSPSKMFDANAEFASTVAMFKEGKLAMIVDGDWNQMSFIEALGDDVDYVKLPVVSGGGQPISYNSIRLCYINRNVEGEELDACLKFIDYMSSVEVQSKLVPKLSKIPGTIEGVKNLDPVENPYIVRNADLREYSVPMPNDPEMRVYWDVLATGLEEILSGRMTPEDGVKFLQKQADSQIEAMKSEAGK